MNTRPKTTHAKHKKNPMTNGKQINILSLYKRHLAIQED